ncbi:hypothetical protein DCAR_0414919 [Daucus carota subsp. sativus]|uniref:Protein kinase domain-containing protein n=1 Tax=Daucus carota subsp. sativus TaxID=79200 RepID=A0AAF1AUM9_DAUCS|nr:hypothetical protein DCAR_0414919 [Daucus carota subsp. sativus]
MERINRTKFQREVMMLETLKHLNIVRFSGGCPNPWSGV